MKMPTVPISPQAFAWVQVIRHHKINQVVNFQKDNPDPLAREPGFLPTFCVSV